MYIDEYPDLIYEGIMYDLDNSFDIIEEGSFSPKSIFKKIINIFKKLYAHIKQAATSIKNKFMQLIARIKEIIKKNKKEKSEDKVQDRKSSTHEKEDITPKNDESRDNTNLKSDNNTRSNKSEHQKEDITPKNDESRDNTNLKSDNNTRSNKSEHQKEDVYPKNDYSNNDKPIVSKEEPKENKKDESIMDYNWEDYPSHIIEIENDYGGGGDPDVDTIIQNIYKLESKLELFASESNMGTHFHNRGRGEKDENEEILNKSLRNREMLDNEIKICKEALEKIQDRPVYKSPDDLLVFIQGEKQPIILNNESKEKFNKIMEDVDSKMPGRINSCNISLKNDSENLNKTIKLFESIEKQVEDDYLPPSFTKYFSNIKDIICKKYTLDLKLYNNILQSFSVNFMQSVKIYEKIQ